MNYEAVLAVGGSRLGHDFYGLWMRSYGYDGSEGFETVLGLLLPWACRAELSVRPRRRAPARSRRAGLTGGTDTDFEGGFGVRWDPGETGWTPGDLLTPELRAALLSGEAYPRWKLERPPRQHHHVSLDERSGTRRGGECAHRGRRPPAVVPAGSRSPPPVT